MISAEEKDENTAKFIEKTSDNIINLIKESTKFISEKGDEILGYLHKNSLYCKNLIEKKEYRNCLFVLIKLNDICLKSIIYKPKEINEELKAILQDLQELIMNSEKTKDNALKIDTSILIKNVKYFEKQFNNHNRMIDEYGKNGEFYFEILNILVDIINNIGVIYHKRKKTDRALYYMNLCSNIMIKMKIYTFPQMFKYVEIALNLILSMSEENNNETISQAFYNLIIFIENLESKLEQIPDHPDIYKAIQSSCIKLLDLVE